MRQSVAAGGAEHASRRAVPTGEGNTDDEAKMTGAEDMRSPAGGDPQPQDRDAGAAGYRDAPAPQDDESFPPAPDPRAHDGQEYGLESHHPDARPFDPSLADSPSFDHDDPGVGQGAAGYGPAGQMTDKERSRGG
jgi:hypothetical protein